MALIPYQVSFSTSHPPPLPLASSISSSSHPHYVQQPPTSPLHLNEVSPLSFISCTKPFRHLPILHKHLQYFHSTSLLQPLATHLLPQPFPFLPRPHPSILHFLYQQSPLPIPVPLPFLLIFHSCLCINILSILLHQRQCHAMGLLCHSNTWLVGRGGREERRKKKREKS